MEKGEASKAEVPEKAPTAASTRRTEPEAQVDQTPVASQPQAGTSQNPPPTPSVPLDTVMKLLQALNPNLNLEATLAQLVNPSQPTPTLQTTTIPAPQSLPESIPPKPDIIEKPYEIAESQTVVKMGEEESEVRVGIEAQPEGEGEGGKVVEGGEKVTESEAVVDEEELQVARERETRAKAGEEGNDVEGMVQEVSDNQGEEDGKSESREATEVLESEEEDEEGSMEVAEETGGSDGAVVENVEGSEIHGTESDTEVVGEGDQNKNEEEGEVVDKGEKKKKKSKAIMRKSQVPYYRGIMELNRGATPTRRSNKIAGMFGKLGFGQEEGQEKNVPMESSSDEQEEEETPLVRKSRRTPVDQVTLKKEREIAAVEEEKEQEAPMQEEELGEKEQSEAGTQEFGNEPARGAAKEPAENEEEVETSQTGQDEDEDDEPPLQGRLRSSRATDHVVETAEEPKGSPPKPQPKASVRSESEEPEKRGHR